MFSRLLNRDWSIQISCAPLSGTQGFCLAFIAVYLIDEETNTGFQIKIALELYLSKSCHLLEKKIGLCFLRNVKIVKMAVINVKDLQTALNFSAC